MTIEWKVESRGQGKFATLKKMYGDKARTPADTYLTCYVVPCHYFIVETPDHKYAAFTSFRDGRMDTQKFCAVVDTIEEAKAIVELWLFVNEGK